MTLAAALGGCAGLSQTVVDPYAAPGKFAFLKCPDLDKRLEEVQARHEQLAALMERSGSGVGGGAVNMFVYQPDMSSVESELRELKQTAAEKNCSAGVPKAPGKPEPGMGPVH
jgi:hypothetical protein